MNEGIKTVTLYCKIPLEDYTGYEAIQEVNNCLINELPGLWILSLLSSEVITEDDGRKTVSFWLTVPLAEINPNIHQLGS